MPRRPLFHLVLGLTLAIAANARGAGPAEALFRLVPPDAGLTLAIEDLRGHARQFFEAPLSDGLRQLPAVRAWFASSRFQGFLEARGKIEKALGVNVAKIRDDLLGDAVVLTLRVSPGGRQDDARGLLLVKVRDRALLDRLVQEMNAAQQKKGELVRVAEHARGSSVYFSREFRPGLRKPTEYYTTLDDNSFAWSNAEELVQGVIDRKAGERSGLGNEAPFQRVRRRLPERAAVSLFASPRFLTSLLAGAPKSSKPSDVQFAAMLSRHVNALEYAGAAIEWRNGLILHTEEALDPKKIDPWLRNWATQTSSNPLAHRLPATALALATAHVDFGAVGALVRDVTPESERPRLDTFLLALKGVMLGNDPASLLVYPHMGPGVLTYVEAPGAAGAQPFFPIVFVINLGNDAGVAAALDNALRTLLALRALEVKQGEIPRLETLEIQGHKVTTLRASSPFAYAFGSDRLVMGNSAEAVARSFTTPVLSKTGFAGLQAHYFPDVESFACVDLEALYRIADAHRPELARRTAAKNHRREADTARDLDQALALVHLFQSAFFTSAIAPDATSIHRTLGLIAKP